MKKILLVVALAAAGYAGWRWQRAPEVDTAEPRLVRDRLWIDHLPRNERETVNVLMMLSREAIGVFNEGSMWRGNYEQFRYELDGDRLRLQFPQTGQRDDARVRARRCNERGMDFCLELEGSSHGAKRYYSREGWEIGSVDDARAKLDELEAAAAQ